MKNLILFNIFFQSIFSWSVAFASSKEDVQSLIRKHHFKEKNLGLVIAADDKILYELNSSKLMIPASLTKIFTASAILNNLPLNTKFKTELWSKGKIVNGTLRGPICIKGGGDPSFVSEKMWFLVNELTRNEIRKIEGDLIVDVSRFDNEIFDAGRESTRVDRAYDAPISPISFNWNSVNVFVRPSEKIDEEAKVYIDPINSYIELENKAKTGKEGSSKTLEVTRVKIGDHDKIIVSGKIPLGSSEHVSYKSITNPSLWVANHLKEFLKQRGIEINGSFKEAKCEDGSFLLASVDSKNLSEMISDMLKFSNNFVAEMLAKNLASEKNPSTPAKMKDAIIEIKKYLNGIGIKESEYELENVSGLTRANKFTAVQILKALNYVKNDFNIFPEFLSALPIAGVDGTMKSRMKNQDGVVRAKTGYLDGIVGLAGYVARDNKTPITFVFMFNGGYDEGLASRKLFDDIIERVKKWD